MIRNEGQQVKKKLVSRSVVQFQYVRHPVD